MTSYDQYEAAHQIRCKYVKNWLRYACLCISKMAAVRHLGFVILQFWTTDEVCDMLYLLCHWRNDPVWCDRDIAILRIL